MQKEQKPSAGLVYMQAAAAAMPKTLGDRERIAAFDAAMVLAIRNRFPFVKHDVEALLRMAIRTCVGVFRPLDHNFYRMACCFGGTYAKMWEAHHNQKPWIALTAIGSDYVMRDFELMPNNRVTLGLGVLLPQSFDAPDECTIDVEGKQVWWVTSQDDEHITVCRYRVTHIEVSRVGRRALPFQKHGHPFRIRKLTRAQWDELNAAPVEEKQAA